MSRKVLSLFLSFVIVFSVFSVTATANAQEISTANAKTTTEEVDIIGTNAVGNMIADEYSENVNEENFIGNNIYEIEVENSTVYVDLQALTDAKLMIALYDESTQEMLCTGMKDISTDDTIVQVELDIDTMPQYFVIKAYLLDAETNVPLCKQFECDTYTQTMQEFLSKTTEDFEQEKVLALDEQNDNNFLVYNDETIQTTGDENTNVVTVADETAHKYVIENINETISSLQEGDIFSHTYGNEENILIIKVSSITIDGTTATIYGEEVELEEAFDFIKIDASQGSDKTTIDTSELEDGVEYLGTEDETTSKCPSSVGGPLVDEEITLIHSHKFGLEKDEKHYNISGTIGFKFTATLKCYYDAKLFEKDEIEFSFAIKFEANIGVSLSLLASHENPIETKLAKLGFSPVPGLYINFTPALVVKGTVNITLNGILSGQIGKTFKNGEWSDNNKKAKLDAELKLTGDLFIGLSLEPEIGIVGNIASAKATAKTGVKIKALLKYSTNNEPNAKEKHSCTSCIDGTLSWYTEISVKLKFLNLKKLTWEANLFTLDAKIGDFYYSFDTNTFCLYTSCPNNSYRQTITIINDESDINVIEGAYVNGIKTDENGVVILYLTKGAHTLTIENDGTKTYKNIDINGSEEHIINLDSISSTGGNGGTMIEIIEPEETKPTALETGKCGDDVSYTIYDDGKLVIEGVGKMYDYPQGQSPFTNNEKIISAVIEDGVTSIGELAFKECTTLKGIVIPDSVTSIGESAFWRCTNLTNITIPDSVTSLGNSTFIYCANLTSVKLPKSISQIGSDMFNGCLKLENVIIPDGVLHIGNNAFFSCTKLNNITIPNSVTSIGNWAFYFCSISNVFYHGTPEQWTQMSIGTYNNKLIEANICYISPIKSASAVGGNLTNKTSNSTIGTTPTKQYTRKNLVPNTEALLMVVQGTADDYEINTSTLRYIAQTTVDENGTATFNTFGDFSDNSWSIVLIFGECTHSSSKWETVKESTYTETGLEVCVCDHCGEVIESKEIDVLAPEYPLGDVNNDMIVNIEDATQIQKYLVEIISLTDSQLKNADIDNDGIVSVRDATEIQKHLIGISSYLNNL